MSEANVEEVLEALSMNREIEFEYKGNSYAFVFHQEGWALVDRSVRLSKYYKTNRELANEARIDGRTFLDLLKSGDLKIEMIL